MRRPDFIELARQAAWAAYGRSLRGAVVRGWAALWDNAPRHMRRHVEAEARKALADSKAARQP